MCEPLADADLLAELRKRYAPTVIPPCHICGAELSLQAFGGGEPSRWACDGLACDTDGNSTGYRPSRSIADQHYSESTVVDRRRGGDSDVIDLIDRYTERTSIYLVEDYYDCEGGQVLAIHNSLAGAKRSVAERIKESPPRRWRYSRETRPPCVAAWCGDSLVVSITHCELAP